MKLTLNQAWKLCLEQWKWIDKQLDKDSLAGIVSLKRQWCRVKEFKDVTADCFFCEYNNQKGSAEDRDNCKNCPGRLINRKFYCDNGTYDYNRHPRKFYKKILGLNKKRLDK
ncbi:hypothetical protein LCGC14_1127170 [marine sediment metagenome]|uniref:Uncharacterized protein n=1 Tax=marine sediment metagenome TaxID=412755 RepID=A0A0F9Q7Z5_9ZZZZ